MFDIGASELLLIVIVAVVVIGPKDMPMALRTAGRWIGRMRKMSNHFRAGIDAMVREAELEEMERKWREQNEAIMKASPQLPTLHPTADDMQPPVNALPQPGASVPEEPSAYVQTQSQTPSSDGERSSPPPEAERDIRQTELHLPPPPP
ncbi:Sec-independent protein translocase protein TatB [Novosphingobium sp. Leaf2]|uniref:Sec-independent protein translocase protein TatB n=1 Tax=Novosphingobium sp. Leaf2 TaxID=1735670 RepID=UPI0006F67F6A|nr:Sec-independent protein translocase protein TatB [Novosphingobium sp. Leaf2]KQM22116.1 preprotein translocase subunit TatB [Novosphingobium sp. Leaf2]